MGKFKFKDYRQPWETGPHWKLKQEFMEKYCNTFPEERLLCLAQAYSNVVLMDCSYPAPVMRQINELSKPLQMRKRFQQSSDYSQSESSDNQQNRFSGKAKAIYEKCGKPFKEIKFCHTEEVKEPSNSFDLNPVDIEVPINIECTEMCKSNLQEDNTSAFHLATGKGTSEQKPKFEPTETDVNILIDLSSQASSKVECDKTDISKSSVKRTINDIDCISSEKQDINIKRQKSSDLDTKKVERQNLNKQPDKMKRLQFFGEKLRDYPKKTPPFAIIYNVARSLFMLGSVVYACNDSKSKISECICKFLFSNVLISIGKGVDKKHAKWNAAELAFTKLINLSKYEIQDGELKESKNDSVDEPIDSATNKEPFILNQKLFNNSIQAGFLLIDNLNNVTISHRSIKAVLADSASHWSKSFKYDIEDIHGNEHIKYRVNVLIDGKVVGTGESDRKPHAKMLACDNAIEMLRKEYYVLKMKNEYIDECIITRDQVATSKSFPAHLSENNKGYMMLKNMGWTGGGLKPSSISEPIEVKGVSLGRCLGWQNGGKGKKNEKKSAAKNEKKNAARKRENEIRGDISLFRERLSSILQEYSKSNSMKDLIFAKDFLNIEKKEIHEIAAIFNLKTVNHGHNENRFLSVMRKYTVTEILNHLSKIGGSNSKFELIDSSNTPFKVHLYE